jgi:hypothetical protein
VDNIEVHLPDALQGFRLPDPPPGQELVSAIQASLRMIGVAGDTTTVPLFASIWAAPLVNPDFAPHLAGPTGAGKTELAALVQQHFGPGLDARHLPASWSSTGNALETLAFYAKDALLVVDDFAPTGSAADVQRFHREADRLLRAQGNRSARQRLHSNAALRPAKPPRGLIISTGEDVPKGQSLRARLLVLELAKEGPNAINWEKLSRCQADAAQGLYAQALAGYLQWLAPQYEKLSSTLNGQSTMLRQQFQQEGRHQRTAGILASLALGLDYFLIFAGGMGAINPAQQDQLWQRYQLALAAIAATQEEQQAPAEPVSRFLELISAAIASGRAHVAAPDGAPPAVPQAWGWRQVMLGIGDKVWHPQGQRIGWVEGEDLYLEPDAAYAEAQGIAQRQGDSLPVTIHTLKQRLKEQGFLASTETRGGRERLEVRHTLEGQRRQVIHLHRQALFTPKVAQVAQVAQSNTTSDTNQGIAGPQFGPQKFTSKEKVAQESGPLDGSFEAAAAGDGPPGPLGPQTSAYTQPDVEDAALLVRQVLSLSDELDNTMRGLRSEPTQKAQQQVAELKAKLHAQGATIINPVGLLADPNGPMTYIGSCHDVSPLSSNSNLVAVVDPAHQPQDGEVVGVLRVGCTLAGHLIREAQVIVYQPRGHDPNKDTAAGVQVDPWDSFLLEVQDAGTG